MKQPRGFHVRELRAGLYRSRSRYTARPPPPPLGSRAPVRRGDSGTAPLPRPHGPRTRGFSMLPRPRAVSASTLPLRRVQPQTGSGGGGDPRPAGDTPKPRPRAASGSSPAPQPLWAKPTPTQSPRWFSSHRSHGILGVSQPHSLHPSSVHLRCIAPSLSLWPLTLLTERGRTSTWAR